MSRVWAMGLCAVLVILWSTAGWADGRNDSREEAWARARRSIKAAATETGHAARDVVRATRKEAARAAHEVDDSTREARGDAAKTGESVWNQAKEGIAEALEDLSAALRDLTRDSD